MENRKSGILLHITSLPSDYGVGDLGPTAYRFVDFLQQAGQGYWQVLPLNPTALFNSPYSSPSAFAFNSCFISPELMVRDGWISQSDIESVPKFQEDRVDYSSVMDFKAKLFAKGYERFKASGRNEAFKRFCRENSLWLEDYALFVALKSEFKENPWWEWPDGFKNRDEDILRTSVNKFHERLEMEKFIQFLFYWQWSELKDYSRERGVRLFGDVAIYVTRDSADVWAHPELFKLGPDKNPYVVAGVPPDYFNKTGQLWGNPIYNWEALRERNYEWWVRRMDHNLRCFDLVRIDHFRGFIAAWEVPAGEKTAENGRWVEGPAMDFFSTLIRKILSFSIVAEDLGHITPDVRAVMERLDFPGIKLLVFAFGDGVDRNPYAPHNHVKNCVVYTGTHDCNTLKGWFDEELSENDRERLFTYLGGRYSSDTISREMVRLAMMSVADTVIIPMQDILGLGAEARLNIPGTTEGNWEWRLPCGRLTEELACTLQSLTKLFGRG